MNSKCIYNPLDNHKILRLSKNNKKFNFFKKNKYLRIINIGRFTDQKNQILILKAFKSLIKKFKLKLLMAGRGPNQYLLKNYIKKVNILIEKKLNLLIQVL